jgi:hypothetical protein
MQYIRMIDYTYHPLANYYIQHTSSNTSLVSTHFNLRTHVKNSGTRKTDIHCQLTSKMVGDKTVGPVTPFEAVPDSCTFRPFSGKT